MSRFPFIVFWALLGGCCDVGDVVEVFRGLGDCGWVFLVSLVAVFLTFLCGVVCGSLGWWVFLMLSLVAVWCCGFVWVVGLVGFVCGWGWVVLWVRGLSRFPFVVFWV